MDKQDSYLTTTIKLSSDLLMNQEYSLQLSLETNKGTAYYYTRVVSRSNVNAAQKREVCCELFPRNNDWITASAES
ncbi:MAG: hypothetical protein ACLU6Y_05460 [Ruminococcus sp.]